VKGLRFQSDRDGVRHNYSYFPVFISEDYPLSRDALYEKLKENKVFARRYFYPLISDFSTYRALPSAHPDNLPVAKILAEQVLCLPIYPDLGIEEVENICSRIKNF
jgi:dTDP-4-amino-4,6-dideoxygalactose transaminase